MSAGGALAQRRWRKATICAIFRGGRNHRGAQPSLVPARWTFHRRENAITCEDAGVSPREYLIRQSSMAHNIISRPNAPSHYVNNMLCVRRDIRWRPGRGYNSTPCTVAGVQTALVVGPAGEEIHTDALGRIRLQFHWDRLGEFDERSSPWIRVMMPMAGPQMGQIALPRVGQEVVVQFQDGNIDHPIVIGVVYNSANPPPWQLPQQRALRR